MDRYTCNKIECKTPPAPLRAEQGSGSLNLDQPKSEFFKMLCFTISRPQKKRKPQPGGEAASLPAWAIVTSIGLHGHTRFFLKNSGLAWVQVKLATVGNLNFNMMLKIEFKIINVVYGLI
jgi:hypothetical protein